SHLPLAPNAAELSLAGIWSICCAGNFLNSELLTSALSTAPSLVSETIFPSGAQVVARSTSPRWPYFNAGVNGGHQRFSDKSFTVNRAAREFLGFRKRARARCVNATTLPRKSTESGLRGMMLWVSSNFVSDLKRAYSRLSALSLWLRLCPCHFSYAPHASPPIATTRAAANTRARRRASCNCFSVAMRLASASRRR